MILNTLCACIPALRKEIVVIPYDLKHSETSEALTKPQQVRSAVTTVLLVLIVPSMSEFKFHVEVLNRNPEKLTFWNQNGEAWVRVPPRYQHVLRDLSS